MSKKFRYFILFLVAAFPVTSSVNAQDKNAQEKQEPTVQTEAPKVTSVQKFRPEIPNAKYLIPGRSLIITSADGSAPATVEGEEISWDEYNQRLSKEAQSVFYHRTVPFGEEAELRTKVINDMVLEKLKMKDAQKRGVSFDKDWVDGQVSTLDKRYRGNENWEKQRDTTLPKLRANFERESLLKNLEAKVREVTPPSSEQVRKYFNENEQQFIEPSRQKMSAILLGVDPSSHTSVWDKAKKEAEGILEKLKKGDDFAEIASLRSTDPSAGNGGDLGYLHEGMLNEGAQAAVDKLEVGQTTEPLRLLQGYAIFKLMERTEERKVSFEKSFSRARQLLLRETSDLNWKNYAVNLRKGAKVTINPILEFELKVENSN